MFNYRRASYRDEVRSVFEAQAGCGSILSIKTVFVPAFPCCQTAAVPRVHGIFQLPVLRVKPKAVLYMTSLVCLSQ